MQHTLPSAHFVPSCTRPGLRVSDPGKLVKDLWGAMKSWLSTHSPIAHSSYLQTIWNPGLVYRTLPMLMKTENVNPCWKSPSLHCSCPQNTSLCGGIEMHFDSLESYQSFHVSIKYVTNCTRGYRSCCLPSTLRGKHINLTYSGAHAVKLVAL